MLRLLGLVAGSVAALGLIDTAKAQTDFSGAVGCGAAKPDWVIPEQLWDASVNLAHNDIGVIDQDIATSALTYSRCIGLRKARWRVESNLATVDDTFGQAQSGSIGVGVQLALGDRASISPIVRVGYASFDTIDDQMSAGVGLVVAGSGLVNASDSLGMWYTYELAPEYTRWQSTDAGVLGVTLEDGVFSNFAAVGIDAPISDSYRGRVRLGHRYIDSDEPVTSIYSAILSLRRDNPDGCNNRCWSTDLWLSQGDGDYRSVLIGISLPLGR